MDASIAARMACEWQMRWHGHEEARAPPQCKHRGVQSNEKQPGHQQVNGSGHKTYVYYKNTPKPTLVPGQKPVRIKVRGPRDPAASTCPWICYRIDRLVLGFVTGLIDLSLDLLQI